MRFANSFSQMIILSFLLHITIMGVATLTIKRKPVIYVPSTYRVKIVTPVKTVKRRVPEKKPDQKKAPAKAKPSEKETALPRKISKNDITMIEERIKYIKAKKKVEEIVKLRSMVDISVEKIEERVREKSLRKEEEIVEREPVQTGVEEPDVGGMLDAYYSEIALQIRREWVFPEILKDDFLAVILIRIDREGNTRIVRVEESSGNALFDRSVLRAIDKASPLKKPPFEMEIGLRFYP